MGLLCIQTLRYESNSEIFADKRQCDRRNKVQSQPSFNICKEFQHADKRIGDRATQVKINLIRIY